MRHLPAHKLTSRRFVIREEFGRLMVGVEPETVTSSIQDTAIFRSREDAEKTLVDAYPDRAIAVPVFVDELPPDTDEPIDPLFALTDAIRTVDGGVKLDDAYRAQLRAVIEFVRIKLGVDDQPLNDEQRQLLIEMGCDLEASYRGLPVAFAGIRERFENVSRKWRASTVHGFTSALERAAPAIADAVVAIDRALNTLR